MSIDERLDAAVAAANLEGPVLPPPPAIDDRARRAALVAFAVSGATAMTLQVLWTRALAVLIGSSIFSFTLILLAFLIGLGVGAALFGRASQRTPHPVRWLAMLHLATAAAVGVTYLVTDKLPSSSPGSCSRRASASTGSSSASSCWPAWPCCRRRS